MSILSSIIFLIHIAFWYIVSLWPLILAISICIWAPTRWWIKNSIALLIIMCIYGSSYISIQKKNQQSWDKFQEHLSVFHERCNTAEEKIYQTADNVEGILFLKIRSDTFNRHRATTDRHWPDAALPDDLVAGLEYYYVALRPPYESSNFNPPKRERDLFLKAMSSNPNITIPGLYDYIDINKEAKIVRFSPSGSSGEPIKRENVSSNPARYAVSYRNIVNPADREHWVSGITVSIIDTKNNTLMAEKTWYTFNYSRVISSIRQGGANYRFSDYTLSCSNSKKSNAEYFYGATRVFITSVLKPKNIAKSNKKNRSPSFPPSPPHFRSLLSAKMTFGMKAPIAAYIMLLFILFSHIFFDPLKWWKKCLAAIAALLVFVGPFHSVYPVNGMIQKIKNMTWLQQMP